MSRRIGARVDVSQALATRISCRAFTDRAVPKSTIERILTAAARAPSGGNLQPWFVDVLTGEALRALVDDVQANAHRLPTGEGAEYAIYPPDLHDPYRTRRFKCGADLYAALGIERGDKVARTAQFARNFSFFDAPVGVFLSIDRSMGPPQWADLGIFLQSVMLMAREEGLHTCPQEAWAIFPKIVGRHLAMPPDRILFCGMALGEMDEARAENGLVTDREPLSAFTVFHGFE